MRHILKLCLALLLLVTLVPSVLAQTEPRPTKKGRKYTVKIDSSPQQTAIYLDDKKYGIVGYTPYTGKLVTGDYKLILELPGFKTIERTIRVDAKNKEFFVPLEKQELPGTIDVQATADNSVAGASVFIDGLAQGTAPALVDVKEGRHQVQIRKEGFEEYTQWVDLKQGQRVTLTPVLKPTKKEPPKGSLLVDADVTDAEVIVDGVRATDTTPTVIENLDEGPHVVEVRKDKATPWKQTVYVKGGQRTKVNAELKGAGKGGGAVKIIASVAGAEVWIDGRLAGTAPYDAVDLAVGDHLIEVRAKGYAPKEQRVTVAAGGSEIIKFDLVAGGGGGDAKLKIVSPVPEARVFVDGAAVGTAPAEKEVGSGEHFVVVEKEGYAKFEQKVSLEPGQVMTITAALRAAGKVRFLSTPGGAQVLLDGKDVGITPYEQEVEAGDHVVTLRLAGYYDEEQNVKVEGGQTVNVSAPLRLIDDGPTAEDIVTRKATLSSFSARTMTYGDFTVDVSMGYPYWAAAQATVGGRKIAGKPWDVQLGFRTSVATWDFLGTFRLKYFDPEPFSFAIFGTIGGGGGLDGRNQFTLQGGALQTVTFASGTNAVTITGRAFVDFWSDRLCGEEEDGGGPVSGAPDICQHGTASAPFTPEELADLDDFGFDPEDILGRDTGLRFYIGLAAEIAISESMNVFLIFEGAPFQSERAGHSDRFNQFMVGKDAIYNGRLGVTYKF